MHTKTSTTGSTTKRVLGLIKPYKLYLFLSLILSIATVGLTLYAPVLIGEGVDLIISKNQVDFKGLVTILIKLCITILLTSLFQWLMNLCNNTITYRVVKDMRTSVFEHIQHLPLRFLDAFQHGELISRMITDIEQFSDGLLMGFSQLFTGIITILGTLFFMLSINLSITLAVVMITPLSLFVASFIAKKTYSMFKQQSEIRGELSSLIEEMVSGAEIVKAFSQEEEVQKRFDAINARLKSQGTRALFFSSITNPSTRFINGLVYTSVGIIGSYAAMRGRLSIGQLSCFLSYANQYTKPFNEISGVITELQGALASARRVFDIIDAKAEPEDASDAIILKEAEGKINLEHVDFSYNPKVKLLQDLNLSVSPGQRIAIVGPTGCGKSTLINLLMRFYEVNSGTIRVDDKPITSLTRDSLRNNYGMVLQETWLKSGTIKENIAFGKPDATLEEIIAAASAVHAHSFIKRLPHSYDTVISEDGGNLSAGQKQLLCIARVMLTLPPMLILDEATSSIDTRTEIRIQRAFEKMMKGRTSFIVAHRLSTIKEADVILVMKDGNIIEQGTHEALLAKNGFYAHLYNSQFAVS